MKIQTHKSKALQQLAANLLLELDNSQVYCVQPTGCGYYCAKEFHANFYNDAHGQDIILDNYF